MSDSAIQRAFDQNYFTNYIYDKLSRWNSSNQESPKDEKINDDRRDTSTPDPGNHILDGEGNQEDKGDIVCRICEEDVPRHKLRMHSRFCVVYQKTMMKMSGIDAKLQKGCRVANEQGLSIADGLEQLKGIIQNTIPPFGPENPHAIPMCHRYMSELRLIKETFKSVPVVFEACENYERVLNSKREMIKELQETAKLRDSVNYPLGTPYTSTGGDQSPIPSPGTMTPRTGKNALSATCKDFVFIKTISRGAFGRVFLAQKKRTGDYYAIKVLKKEEMSWKNQIERVKAEQRILAGTENPFVVKLYYSFESRDKFFLVMEYIQGGDCYSLLRNLLYLEESQAKMYMAEVVLALEYLHGRGIVHRDLKPDNMLINRDGHIKLTDFGLSRFNLLEDMKSKHPRQLSRDAAPSTTGGVGDTNAGVSVLLGRRRSARISGSYLPDLAAQRGAPVGVGDARLSGVGNVSRNSCVGTPDYLAPEIIRGMEYGPAVDWWALGVVLYELLVGLPPFHAETREIIFQNILEYNSLEIEWPEDDVYVISQDAKDLVAKLLTVDQKKRLGANGAQDVKQHPFFRDVDWDTLLQQKAAFIPQPSDCQDTSYFVDEKGSVTISLDDRADTEDATPSKPPSGEEDRKDESVRQDIDPKGEKTGSKFETDDFNFVNLEFLDHMNNELAQEATLNRKRTGTGSPVVHFHTSGSACPSPAEGKNTYASPRAASLD